MPGTPSSVPIGPIKGHRWTVEPITHKYISDGKRDCLVVATGLWWVLLIFGFTIFCFLFVSILIRHETLVMCLSPFAAAGLTFVTTRFYRSLFWQLAFDLTQRTLTLSRRGQSEVVSLQDVVGFQICDYVDEKNTGFVRYQNVSQQLSLACRTGGEVKRRLIASTGSSSAILNLVTPFSRSTGIAVEHLRA